MKSALSLYILLFFVLSFNRVQSQTQQGTIDVLIIDGANNHDWQVTTDALRSTLENAGLFRVSVSTAPEQKLLSTIRPPKDEKLKPLFPAFEKLRKESQAATEDRLNEEWKSWNPKFADFDTVLLNYNGRDWNPETKNSFVDYVKNGGGVVLVHAANNAFANWQEFNDIIGMGWRKAPFGKAIKINPDTAKPYWDKAAGNSGHGSKHPFQVTVRAPDHPVMKGLPSLWLHGSDELYHDMRGPAKNMTILSSAFSDPEKNGTGKHEPITWEVTYGKGRVIVTSMGHFWPGQQNMESLQCAGFQTVLSRACEYVATGKSQLPVVSQEINADTITLAPAKSPVDNNEVRKIAVAKKKQNPYCMLTPEEEQTTFRLAPGYTIELVASEPQVREPVLTVWDGNGVMYVAEMRSYMQNVEGKGTKEAKDSTIKRLEDTNADGTYDRITTFAENLSLPRAILPLDDRIAVRETDSMDIICLRDTTGDGVADEKTLLYERGSYGRGAVGVSVEHQDSIGISITTFTLPTILNDTALPTGYGKRKGSEATGPSGG
ncbi:MAG: ThuA domain-containing protein [Verrucomicrobiales bacterium]|nr:ThuA domain-containing protein [Verrucomicrobiales bacterium]